MGDKKLMPMAKQDRPNAELQWDVLPRALERWTPGLMAAASENTISIFDPIGVDMFTGAGVTAKRISAALRAIGEDNDVVVLMNSPGGDLFEGMAIYNLLREHKGSVTVKILGLAASAASIIAMAGDEIQIARAGFLMIHNTWVVAIGNRNDLRDIADELEPFDFAMADIYGARTGIEQKLVRKKMDAETWINGSAAVDEGWADSLLPADEVKQDKSSKGKQAAGYRLDMALAKSGLPRSERRALLQDYKAGADAGDLLHPLHADAGEQSSEESVMTEDAKKPAAEQPATTEQLAVAEAKGFEAGKAAAAAEAKAAADKAAPQVDAAKVERERIKAITDGAAGKDHPVLAKKLALDTEMSAADAEKFMAGLPKEAVTNPLAAAMPKNPNVGADVEPVDNTEAKHATSTEIYASRRAQIKSVR